MVFTDSEKFALYAINIMLQTISEQPLEDEVDLQNSLEGRIAQDTLEEVKKAVLSEGWNFNRDERYSLAPNTSGTIAVPFNILDISASSGSDIVMRDWRLYSKSEQSSYFEDAVDCDIIWDMEFNSLSHPIRHYITIRAARIFQYRMVGDTDSYAFTDADETNARAAALNSDTRTRKHNWFTKNTNDAVRG